MAIHVLGIDLAKNIFQLHGVTRRGRVVLTRRVRRDRLLDVVAQIEPCLIGIEACSGAFYWQRQFERFGHTVRIVSPQYVKPFVRRQKTDGNDAEAICTAVQQPNMRFVPRKTVEQQDVQSLHRARQRLVNHRTALFSQMRGILLDRGIAFGQAASRVRRLIPEIIANLENDLSPLAREILTSLYAFLRQIDERIRDFDRRIEEVFRRSSLCQRIGRVKGVGPQTATAMVAAIGDGRDFKNGRHLAAWLGLVPRQHSSSDRRVLMGISKHGNQHLRTLLVHGARAVVRAAVNKSDPRNAWVNQLRARRGFNRATVAVANKKARIIWAVLHHCEPYRSPATRVASRLEVNGLTGRTGTLGT